MTSLSIHPTFDRALQAVAADTELSPARKTEIRRHVMRFCETMLHRPLDQVPADARWIAAATRDWTGRRFGVEDKTLDNILSSVTRAVRVAAGGIANRKPIQAIQAGSGPWAPLALALRGSWRLIKLTRLIRWCDAEDIAPEAVDDTVVERFLAEEAKASLSDKIASKRADIRKSWNNCVDTVPGWPRQRLVLRASSPVLLPRSAFPASLREEIARYVETGGTMTQTETGPVNFLEFLRVAGPRRIRIGRRQVTIVRLGQTTAAKHADSIYKCASSLVQAGHCQIGDLHSIADVATPLAVGYACEGHKQRNGETPEAYSSIHSVIGDMIAVSQRCLADVPIEHWQALYGMKAKAVERVPTGMTGKNRARIDQFDDPAAFADLVSCSEWVMGRLEETRRRRRPKKDATVSMAREAEGAIANLLLCSLPERRQGLGTLHLDRNFRWPSVKGGTATLTYEADQRKTDGVSGVVLPPWKVRLLEIYVRHYRPLLAADSKNRYLFPGREVRTADRPKTLGKLASTVVTMVRRETGLIINLHLYRHLMGAVLYREHGDIAKVEQLLGHSRGSRATQKYVELSRKWAAAALDELTDAARRKGPRRSLRRHRRR